MTDAHKNNKQPLYAIACEIYSDASKKLDDELKKSEVIICDWRITLVPGKLYENQIREKGNIKSIGTILNIMHIDKEKILCYMWRYAPKKEIKDEKHEVCNEDFNIVLLMEKDTKKSIHWGQYAIIISILAIIISIILWFFPHNV